MDQDRWKDLTETIRKLGEEFQKIGDAAKGAARAQDGYTIAEHPDLDILDLELNNFYGNSFD